MMPEPNWLVRPELWQAKELTNAPDKRKSSLLSRRDLHLLVSYFSGKLTLSSQLVKIRLSSHEEYRLCLEDNEATKLPHSHLLTNFGMCKDEPSAYGSRSAQTANISKKDLLCFISEAAKLLSV